MSHCTLVERQCDRTSIVDNIIEALADLDARLLCRKRIISHNLDNMAINSSKLRGPLVQHLVKAESLRLTRQIDTLHPLIPEESLEVHSVSGSTTITSSAKFGSKLDHTVGFGMLEAVEEADLRAIEHPYRPTKLQPDKNAFQLLSPMCSVTSSFQCPNLFINAAATGFHSGGRLIELLTILAQSAANRPDTTLYVAKIDGRLVGTAAMGWIVSSLPHAKGKDVHRALVEARLIAAKIYYYGPSRKRECAKY